jgi:serine/threonine-protein kinase
MSASGGEPERITTVDTDAGEFAHAAPEWLPGGRSVLFTVIPRTSAPEQIAVASLETGEHRVLLEGSHPRYVGTGHLFFRRGTTLWRVPFDARDAQLAGEPVPVLEGVRAAPRSASFALGGNGSLAYFPERGQTESPRALVWVDRQGQEEELPLPPRSYVWPRVSPDGMHAAVWTIDSRDVWVTELERGTLSRLTTYEGNDTTPLWTPSGERVVFQSTRAPRGLYSKAADGTGTVELLLRANEDWAFMNPMSWSGDGRTLVFHYWSHDTAGDIGVLPMGGE